MINHNDSIYKIHEHCESVIKYYVDRNDVIRARLYCCEHNKWLYILTLEEERALFLASPELFEE